MEHFEKLYKPKEVAASLGLSVRTVIRMFRDEPGVLKFGVKKVLRRKKPHVTLRIPQSAIDRAKEGKLMRLSRGFTLFRRHTRDCEDREKGRSWRKCHCPVWCDGMVNGKRVRESLATASWACAEQRVEKKFDPDREARDEAERHRLGKAIGAYLDDCAARQLRTSTIRSYVKLFDHLSEFAQRQEYGFIEQFDLQALTEFRGSRRAKDGESLLAPTTARKEIECLRGFFEFCRDRRWINENFARKLRPPKQTRPPTLPFSSEEVQRILTACRLIGAPGGDRSDVERARNRIHAFVKLLLYSGLRISDAAALKRSQLDQDSCHLQLRQMKTGTALSVKLPRDLADELLDLPPGGEHFFWTGKGALASLVGNLRATIASAMKAAGIEGGHPHRFRDTFACFMLEQDVPIRTVSLLLGHTSIRTTEKHYAPFVSSQQRLLDAAVAKLDFLSPPEPKLTPAGTIEGPLPTSVIQ